MRDLVGDSRRSDFAPPVFVHRASVEAGDTFFAKRAPEARVVADPDGALFRAFGLRRGNFWQLFGPAVWLRGLRALFKGNGLGQPRGDTLQMPGAFIVRGGEVLWSYRARHAGDQPRLRDIMEVVAGA